MTLFFVSKLRFHIFLAPFFWALVLGYDYGTACDQANVCTISNMTVTAGISPDLPSNVILNRITKLSFVNSRLMSIPVELIAGMMKLQRLNASSCQLEIVSPIHFGVKQSYALQHLTHLSLRQNSISRLEDQTFAGTKKLQVLDLSDNSISNVSTEALIRLQALVELDLSHNKIPTLHEKALVDLKLLQKLNLSGNLLKAIVGRQFQTNSRLKSLYLSWNQAISIPPQALPQSLVTLAIHESALTLQSLRGGMLRNMKELETLDLSSNGLKNMSLAWLTDQVQLNALNIAGNDIQEILNHDKIAKILPKLRYIDISKNNWDCTYLKNLQKVLSKNKISVLRKDDNFKKAASEDGVICTNPSKFKSAVRFVKNWFNKATTKTKPITTRKTLTKTTITPKTTLTTLSTPNTPKPATTTSTTPTTTTPTTTTLKTTTQEVMTTIMPTTFIAKNATKISATASGTKETSPTISTTITWPTNSPPKLTEEYTQSSISSISAKEESSTRAFSPKPTTITENSTPNEPILKLFSFSTKEQLQTSTTSTAPATIAEEPTTSYLSSDSATLTEEASTLTSTQATTTVAKTPTTKKSFEIVNPTTPHPADDYVGIDSPLVILVEPWNFQSQNLWLIASITALALILSLIAMLSLVITIVAFTNSSREKEDEKIVPFSNEHLFDFNTTVC